MPTTRSQDKHIELHDSIKRKRKGSGADSDRDSPKKRVKSSTSTNATNDEGHANAVQNQQQQVPSGPSGKEVRGNKDVGEVNKDTEYEKRVREEAVEKRKWTRMRNAEANERKANGNANDKDKGTGKDNEHSEEEEEEQKVFDETVSSTKTEASPSHSNIITKSETRKNSTPNPILEKGIIYFFFRARVGIDTPKSANDIARSYIVLRPFPLGGAVHSASYQSSKSDLTSKSNPKSNVIKDEEQDRDKDLSLSDIETARLLMMPKKVLPKSPRDRFIVVVEKANVSVEELRDDFVKGREYETKTVGWVYSFFDTSFRYFFFLVLPRSFLSISLPTPPTPHRPPSPPHFIPLTTLTQTPPNTPRNTLRRRHLRNNHHHHHQIPIPIPIPHNTPRLHPHLPLRHLHRSNPKRARARIEGIIYRFC